MNGSYFYTAESSQSLLAHALLNRAPKYIGNTKIDKLACIQDIRRDITNSDCKNVIILSEHFSITREISHIQKIYDTFQDLFESMTVIVYLRRQDYLLESTWSQRIKLEIIVISFDDF